MAARWPRRPAGVARSARGGGWRARRSGAGGAAVWRGLVGRPIGGRDGLVRALRSPGPAGSMEGRAGGGGGSGRSAACGTLAPLPGLPLVAPSIPPIRRYRGHTSELPRPPGRPLRTGLPPHQGRLGPSWTRRPPARHSRPPIRAPGTTPTASQASQRRHRRRRRQPNAGRQAPAGRWRSPARFKLSVASSRLWPAAMAEVSACIVSALASSPRSVAAARALSAPADVPPSQPAPCPTILALLSTDHPTRTRSTWRT